MTRSVVQYASTDLRHNDVDVDEIEVIPIQQRRAAAAIDRGEVQYDALAWFNRIDCSGFDPLKYWVIRGVEIVQAERIQLAGGGFRDARVRHRKLVFVPRPGQNGRPVEVRPETRIGLVESVPARRSGARGNLDRDRRQRISQRHDRRLLAEVRREDELVSGESRVHPPAADVGLTEELETLAALAQYGDVCTVQRPLHIGCAIVIQVVADALKGEVKIAGVIVQC